jgi:hypothetical protein
MQTTTWVAAALDCGARERTPSGDLNALSPLVTSGV